MMTRLEIETRVQALTNMQWNFMAYDRFYSCSMTLKSGVELSTTTDHIGAGWDYGFMNFSYDDVVDIRLDDDTSRPGMVVRNQNGSSFFIAL